MTAITGISSGSEDLRANYLMLLIEQLKNQDPMDPMSNEAMTAQLTSLSQLERLEGLDSKFEEVLAATQLEQATGLIGKTIAFFPSGGLDAMAGPVSTVDILDGEVSLRVGTHRVSLDQVVSVSE